MIRLGLESISKLCKKLNNPQDELRFIHVVGTNGKGSTSEFLASVLKECGLKTGVFSSPAVFSEYETIRIGRKNISKRRYNELYEKVSNASKELLEEGAFEPTEFEKQTAIAFLYFCMEECDIVVLETGMGGALDATNVVKNTIACVFTSISMDHTDYLGDSLYKIAETKAGIIKNGAVIYTSNTDETVISAISSEASRHNTVVNITKTNKKLKPYLNLRGHYQLENASLAVETLKGIFPYVANNGRTYELSERNIQKGLMKAGISGRFDLISKRPDIIIDGGHNPGAALALRSALEESYGGKKRLIFVVGMLNNKDHDTFLGILLPLAWQVLTVSTFGERGFSANELGTIAMKYNSNITSAGGLSEAMDLSSLLADKNTVIVVCGTFTILKEVRQWVKEKTEQK